ncbi:MULTISPECIES: hypothetical protein [Paenibacillus]|uniref:hypothetical protein n=1 Tax=Paenibacillus TaxID=44249 RepID=UPI00147895C7|nr:MULTISPECIES: hypothetical protein [Paenibacillus]MBV6716616.1 hypothetical protein [Paenibacillus chitinolyticus]
MIQQLKRLFVSVCPHCGQPLQSDEATAHRVVKICPGGHYTEETYGHLGVRVVYTDN